MSDFDAALSAFIAALDAANAKVNATMTACPDYYKPVTLEAGSKNIRVVQNGGCGRSVHCFVEKSTGNILKAAGWKAPAKGARGNIFNPESYAKCDPYGSWLYLR
jgi:hypothetical protein